MPVEIRELIIRAVIDDSLQRNEPDPDREHRGNGTETDAIIEECVRQVLKILKKSGEK